MTEKKFISIVMPSELEQVIAITGSHRLPKKEKHKDLYQILVVIDDFADDANFTRKSQLLHQLYIRGRHYMSSTITPTQVYT